jgi:hypothetical protein
MASSASLIATLSLLVACTPSLRVAIGGAPPPAAEPAPYLDHTTCPRSQVPFDEAARRLKEGPPAIPGDDGTPVRLSFVDASHTFDLVRMSIEAQYPTGSVVLYISDERQPVARISVPAGPAPTLRVHAIVRPAIGHGMFRNVSVCFDKWSTFTLRATDSEIPLKLEDGDEASAPGQWSLFRVDPFHLQPTETRDRWENLERIEHVSDPRD